MKCTSLLNGTGIAKTHPEWLSYTFNTVCLSSGVTPPPKHGKTDGFLPVNETSKLNTECSRRVKCSGSDVWGSGLPFAITHDSHQLVYGRWFTSCKARSSGEGSACKGCCFGIGCPKGSACSVANSWRTCKRNLSACCTKRSNSLSLDPAWLIPKYLHPARESERAAFASAWPSTSPPARGSVAMRNPKPSAETTSRLKILRAPLYPSMGADKFSMPKIGSHIFTNLHPASVKPKVVL